MFHERPRALQRSSEGWLAEQGRRSSRLSAWSLMGERSVVERGKIWMDGSSCMRVRLVSFACDGAHMWPRQPISPSIASLLSCSDHDMYDMSACWLLVHASDPPGALDAQRVASSETSVSLSSLSGACPPGPLPPGEAPNLAPGARTDLPACTLDSPFGATFELSVDGMGRESKKRARHPRRNREISTGQWADARSSRARDVQLV